MITNKYTAYAVFVGFVVVMTNLCDILYRVYIVEAGYHFLIGTDLLYPLGISLLLGYFFFIWEDRYRKKYRQHK